MIVVEHAGICSCGICNCSFLTCIEQVVGFAFLAVKFSVLGLAVDVLSLNKVVVGFLVVTLAIFWFL
jgi:hypothetical protein